MGLILRHDTISKFLILMAYVINIYLLTFDVSFDTAFPAFLLLGSLVMSRYINKIVEDPEIDEEEASNITYFTALALAGIGAGSMVVSRNLFIFPAKISGELRILAIGVFPLAVLHAALMAIAEEPFFRGVFLQWFSPLGMSVSIVATTLIGVIYHLRVYGTTGGALMYVALAWMIFSYVAWRTRRISPLILAHLFNNLISMLSMGVV